MEPVERRRQIETSVLGGVTYHKAVPISYWDVYTSGWPIFGILAAAGELVTHDMSGATGSSAVWELPGVGMTGIDLGSRDCCDFIDKDDDKFFLKALQQSLLGDAPVPPHVSLIYLAQSSSRSCSWGKASAYFALADALLARPVPGAAPEAQL
eukprot:gnl/MRDRNA2_/MRDRNA2_404790_c0_seq1.p1 gnl/MRDRNA2_/MRDRNA2_404790_c0~~gnl/MRDRNA2_/MRDRNA2_404790_c0_seq1.p1  ORF type:complete len:172 (+),score=31.70 gnl/MRDRNA2_/MRDRNA2_404790_c0_seq1:59-517(+)